MLFRVSEEGWIDRFEPRAATAGAEAVVWAIDDARLRNYLIPRLRSCRLYCYHLPPRTFACIDECAGYFVSRVPVIPVRMDVFDDPLSELVRRHVEVRTLASLWPLHDAVIESSLQYSMIRMRNALPRCAA
jgi:hypothetical protein